MIIFIPSLTIERSVFACVDLRTVAGKLGHANSTTTQLVYSPLVKSAEKETADMMESFIQNSTEKAQIKKPPQNLRRRNYNGETNEVLNHLMS